LGFPTQEFAEKIEKAHAGHRSRGTAKLRNVRALARSRRHGR
jgi:hypothetical protein